MNIRTLFFLCFMAVKFINASEPENKKLDFTPEKEAKIAQTVDRLLRLADCNDILSERSIIDGLLQGKEKQDTWWVRKLDIIKCYEFQKVLILTGHYANHLVEEFAVPIDDLTHEELAAVASRVKEARDKRFPFWVRFVQPTSIDPMK